jgi:hypothetical protein
VRVGELRLAPRVSKILVFVRLVLAPVTRSGVQAERILPVASRVALGPFLPPIACRRVALASPARRPLSWVFCLISVEG